MRLRNLIRLLPQFETQDTGLMWATLEDGSSVLVPALPMDEWNVVLDGEPDYVQRIRFFTLGFWAWFPRPAGPILNYQEWLETRFVGSSHD